MNDIYKALPGLSDLIPQPTVDQWPMSDINNEWGVSLPETHPSIMSSPVPESVENAVGIDDAILAFSAANMFRPSGSTPKTTLGAVDDFSNLMLLSTKDKSSKEFRYGWGLKTAASAGKLFTQLLTAGTAWGNANRQATNTKLQAENQMAALDNQVLYYKNQITDKFNTLLARNTVTMAAKNLRVSAGTLLETTKDAAYDATKDIEMLESNANLKKISLESQQRQADITKKLQKTQIAANLIQGVADLGLTVATANVAGMKYGDLFNDIFGSEDGSLNKSVYGG